MGPAEDKVHKCLDRIKKENAKINAILHINEKAVEEAREIDKKAAETGQKGRLYGHVIAVKSNINVFGMITNCASRVLENYVAPYDATVIGKIKSEDGVIIGMCNMDEFAAGSSGENSAFGATKNPISTGRIPGGSSSGSAASVAAGFCDMALGSDTGGSIRNPASYCGVVGAKPSYGSVSRYGLIDLSMSLDQIGPIGKTTEDAALLLDVIKGKDIKDTKTFESGPVKLEKLKSIKIGVLKLNGVDREIQELIDSKTNEAAKKYGWKTGEIKIEYIDLAVQAYYPMVYTEFFSATRRFDGRRFGFKIEERCGPEVLRRILGGSEISKAEHGGRYYNRAIDVKEIIKKEFELAFEDFNCIILPTCPILPWRLGEGKKMKIEEIYASDALTIPANLAEICAVSIPAGLVKEGSEHIPIGMQIMCAKGKDAFMLSIAKMIEDIK